MKSQTRQVDRQKETEHFHGTVPQALRDKLQAFAKAVETDFISSLPRGEAYGCGGNTQPIYGYHVSGFIPSQLGGFEVSELYRQDCDPSYHFTHAQTEWVNKSQARCYESFRLDSPELNLPENYAYSDLPEKAQNEFSDYENEWFEPALMRFELWVDEKNAKGSFEQLNKVPDTVFFRLSLAYSDAPYYRSKSDDETCFEGHLSAKAVMKSTPEAFVKMLETKFKSFLKNDKR